jgi:N-acetylglucosaminyl-diphospho-decaprenol L-rhamnosyltransferase
MSESQDVDVVILSYYTGDILFECIKSVRKLRGLNKIIIVNNGNPSEVENRLLGLSQTDSNIVYVSGHGNIGFSQGCNLGTTFATAEFSLILNPDCVVRDNDILTKLKHALDDPKYKVATCKILNSDGSIQKTCRRNLLSPQIALTESLNLHKISNIFKPLNRPTAEIDYLPAISEIPALSGAVIFTTKQYYQDIGGLDEQYFLHVEDMDFCMKVYNHGDKIAFVKNAVVTHMLSTSSNTTSKFLESHKARGFIIYITKYFPAFNNLFLRNIFKMLIYLRYFIKVYLK